MAAEHRFFVPAAALASAPVTLPVETSRQIARVLRMKAGDHIWLLDGTGAQYEAHLTQVSPSRVICEVGEVSYPDTEPHMNITLYQALPKGKRMDWVVQKGAEIGISRFVPMMTRYSTGEASQSRLARWQKIAQEAAEQSGRVLFPTVAPCVTFAQALDQARESDLALMGALDAATKPLSEILRWDTPQHPQRCSSVLRVALRLKRLLPLQCTG